MAPPESEEASGETGGPYLFPKFRRAENPRDWPGSVRQRLEYLCRQADLPYGRAKDGITFHWGTRRSGATDYVRAWPQLVAEYIDACFVTLGTDGFGRSDTRAALREFFEVDARHIALAALGALDASLVAGALRRYGIDPVARPPWER